MFTVQTMSPISWPDLITCCQNYWKLQSSVMLRQWAWGQIALSFPHKPSQQEISCSLTQHLSNSLSLSFALSLCVSDFVSECLPFMTLSLHGKLKFKTYVPGTWVHVRTQHKFPILANVSQENLSHSSLIFPWYATLQAEVAMADSPAQEQGSPVCLDLQPLTQKSVCPMDS